eukprot:11212704-Lingulodinium_polyedra.AAC.1
METLEVPRADHFALPNPGLARDCGDPPKRVLGVLLGETYPRAQEALGTGAGCPGDGLPVWSRIH